MRALRRQLLVLLGALLILGLPATALAEGHAATDRQEADGEGPESVTVTDVRVGTHDGFDRVTFEIEGDGLAGWWIEYDDDPRTQGEGAPVDVAGDATLAVAISNVLLPPDSPFETFLDDVPGPEGGVITEVYNDTVFEGIHTFFVGVETELPFTVEREDDPQRVVIDIFHDDTPVDGVPAGAGGTADTGMPVAALPVTAGVVLLAAVGGLWLRRSRA